MRFAVGLLVIIAIASVIGTILKQNEPYPNYVFEFGQYWFQVFDQLGLYDIYHSTWFLTILAFLIISTTLCIARNTRGFLKDIRSYRDKISEHSLAALKHSITFHASDYSTNIITDYLKTQHFRFKIRERDSNSLLIAAKQGAANKLGYFFAHIALIVIAIGGLVDGNLPLKFAELTGRVVPETRNIPQIQIPAHSRLTPNNVSFRGNVTIAEQSSADVVFINAGEGYLVQDLPFIVTLTKFNVDYYSNGMPKLFASDIIITDKATGKKTDAQVRVNHPVIINGIAIYQASFGDGGSPLQFKAWNLASPNTIPVQINGLSLSNQPLRINAHDYQLEFGELRIFNIEDTGIQRTNRSFRERLDDVRQVKHKKQLKNLGPSITFKLRNNQGQAREFHHYMSPIEQEGAHYLIVGTRKTLAEPFHYLRIPLDDTLSIDTFMRLRTALMDRTLYDEIAHASARKAIQSQAITPQMRVPFEQSVKWVLARFADGGFDNLATFLDRRVPIDKQQAVAQTYLKILQGVVIDVMEIANKKAGAKPLIHDAMHYHFLLDSLVATSALQDYGAPALLQMTGFNYVQASGLQMTRDPGKILVYLGSFMLVLGIVFMCYLRQTRLWVLISHNTIRISMSFNRPSHDTHAVFNRHVNAIKQRVKGIE